MQIEILAVPLIIWDTLSQTCSKQLHKWKNCKKIQFPHRYDEFTYILGSSLFSMEYDM